MTKLKPEVQKFNLRMPVDLMERAQEQAAVMGVSLNAFVLMALSDFVRRNDRQARAPTEAAAKAIMESPPLEPERLPRVGRNEPCPCGSGRKAKHCHPEAC